ncbi:transmembrane protein 272-like isoform X2 [Scomber scombrus]|uniref:Transmembrane protein 272-like isoform X2 n=1 Tax=Scomber scombrus TaxID=13677 RepID=A0AAV1N0K4_SCOSC
MLEIDRPQHTNSLETVKTVCIGATSIFLIVQTVIGAVYRNDCPRQPFIPIYLYGFIIVVFLTSCWDSSLTAFVSLCWFIAGSITIYSINEPNYNSVASSSYCNKTLYLFACWSTTFFGAILFLIGSSCCCCCWCHCCRKQQDQDGDAQA